MKTNDTMPRPYWHVDFKWIFGILAAFFLTLSLTLFTLSNLTSEKTAIPIATLIVASQFSRNGLDDASEIEVIKKRFPDGQDLTFPLGDKNVSISRSEIDTLSPREIRLKIFRQIVEPFYYGKIDEQTKKQAGLLAFLNEKTHQTIHQIFLFSIIPLILSFAGLIFFSYRYGKLISPGVVFLFVSTFPAIFLFIVANARSNNGVGGPIPFLPLDVTQEIAKNLAAPYQFFFFLGIGIIILADSLILSSKLRKK